MARVGDAALKTLLTTVATGLTKYRKTRPTPLADEFILSHVRSGGLEHSADVGFVRQVFTGCLRYAKLASVLLDAFYHVHSSESQRSASPLYEVFAYLILLRSDEVGPDLLAGFVASQEPITMLYFLDFLLDEDTVRQWVFDGWCELYDVAFVESQFMASIQAAAASYGPSLVSRLRARVENAQAENGKGKGKESQKKRRGRTTTPVPFALTQPKARALPDPIVMEVGFVANPVPATTYEPDLSTLQAVEDAKQASRVATARRHAEARPFSFTRTHAEENARKAEEEKRRAEAEAREAAEHPVFANPVPDFGAPELPVRLNAAAILREEALYLKALEEEEAKLAALESGQRDETEYQRWMEEGAAAAEAREAQKRAAQKAEARRVRRAAASARSRTARKKAEKVRSVQEEKTKLARERARRDARMAKENAAKIAAASETRESAAAAKAALVAQKQAAAAAMQAEAAAAKKRKAAEDAAAARERAKMIRQIRALERVPQHKYKLKRDPTAANSSYINAMSDVELRERLAAAKRRQEEEVEAKRASIIAAKQAKAAKYRGKMERLAALREAKHAKARAARAAKAKAAASAGEEARKASDAAAVKLSQKLRAKERAKAREQAQHAADERRARARNRFLKGDKDALERVHFAELESAKARSARARQERTKEQALVAQETEAFASHARQVARTHKNLAKTRQVKVADQDFEASKAQVVAGRRKRVVEAKAKVAGMREERRGREERGRRRRPYDEYVRERQRAEASASERKRAEASRGEPRRA